MRGLQAGKTSVARIVSKKENAKARNFAELLSLFSKPMTLEVLEESKNGIKHQMDPRLFLGITPKQYRARVVELVEAGLIKKTGKMYFQTNFGYIVRSKYLPRLEDIVRRLSTRTTNPPVSKSGKKTSDFASSKCRNDSRKISSEI
ncbi:MAG TPA: hypothetical protein VJ792_00235 [Candidatus Nitrosotalea sp.]|nr:hypothetical protein [Candidatus Nitrosotalea sp.]